MRIEVDQSGKIERTQSNTVLAFSNDTEFAVIVLAVEKRECLRRWRQQGKSGKVLYPKLFVAALFLLLKNHLRQSSLVVIDPEYPGHEQDIRAQLLRHIRRHIPQFPADRIVFRQIGKQSRAHKKAPGVFRGLEPANRSPCA